MGTPISRAHALRLLLAVPIGAILLPYLGGCAASGPRAVRMGEEECAHCRMRIADERFVAQLVTQRGRSPAFDSIECMAAWIQSEDGGLGLPVRGAWVADFTRSGAWLEASGAFYLRSDAVRSPMGAGLAAFPDGASAGSHREEWGGELLTWSEVRSLVGRDPGRGGSGEGDHGH